jgi:hypothetical protein
MISIKIGAVIVAAFIAGAFVASPEFRAYAANTVSSIDIIDGQVKTADLAANAVTAAKVKDGEIKAAEIATDAVGAAELQGVTKLLFAQCKPTNSKDLVIGNQVVLEMSCSVSGADTDDTVMATLNTDNACLSAAQAWVHSSGMVKVGVKNDCTFASTWPSGTTIAVIVYDK